MTVIRSSNRPEGIEVEEAKPRFDITRLTTATPKVDAVVATQFLARWVDGYVGADGATDAHVVRWNGGEEVEVDQALVQFGREFVVKDMAPRTMRFLWNLARDRERQLGMPVVLAESDEDQFQSDAPHVYFVDVSDWERKAAFSEICAARGMTTDELEVIALVYVPQPGSGWVGKDGRRRVSQLDSDVQFLLPMVAPLRQGQGETWFHLVRLCVRTLWAEANRPVRDVGNVPLDSLDEAELASLMGLAEDDEPF
jgi:hypothetical protein